jgi:hypothetical protein
MLRATIWAVVSSFPADVYVLLTDLVGTCYDLGELALLLVLSFDDRFDDGRVVGTKVDEDMCDTCLCVSSVYALLGEG